MHLARKEEGKFHTCQLLRMELEKLKQQKVLQTLAFWLGTFVLHPAPPKACAEDLFCSVTSEKRDQGKRLLTLTVKLSHEVMIGIVGGCKNNKLLIAIVFGGKSGRKQALSDSVKVPIGSIWRWQLRWQTPSVWESRVYSELKAKWEPVPQSCLEDLPTKGRSAVFKASLFKNKVQLCSCTFEMGGISSPAPPCFSWPWSPAGFLSAGWKEVLSEKPPL